MPDVSVVDPQEMFAACADRTRLRILNLLSAHHELCVCDIMAVLRQPQAKISRHLGVLRACGLVKQRVEANWRHYRLAKPLNPFHRNLLKSLAAATEISPQLVADQDCLARGVCCAPVSEQIIPLSQPKRSPNVSKERA
jgi:ArsR family transcriptional regulator